MSFVGFSEEDLKRIKSSGSGLKTGSQKNLFKKKNILVSDAAKKQPLDKQAYLSKQNSDDTISSAFDKCRLSLRSSEIESLAESETTPDSMKESDNNEAAVINVNDSEKDENNVNDGTFSNSNSIENISNRKNSVSITPDVVRCVDNYSEDELATHRLKLEELQLQQKLMEEQNKKRKEMLAKALADRTKQTEEEVLKLEKIKKELQILDGQFSQDVSVLRKKIDQACFSYADAEKNYLKIEKEFLQAKISLQKEREKKELLTEHLCALITHNETRKAQKLETLMLELASDKKNQLEKTIPSDDNKEPVVIDGVDVLTGKMVEIVPQS